MVASRISIVIAGLCIILGSASAYADSIVQIPKDVIGRLAQTPDIKFRMANGKAAGGAANLVMSLINSLGTGNQIVAGLQAQEKRVKELLESSGLPGVLIYVEHETSNTVVPITLLVGGKPHVIGPGTDVMQTWIADAISGDRSIRPQVRPGYSANGSASYFLWATLDNGTVAYGLSVPATYVLAEGRRVVSDANLHLAVMTRYDEHLRTQLLNNIESNAAASNLREEAALLLKSRAKALREREQIHKELKEALDRAAKAQRVAAVFETLSRVLTFAQLAAELSAEFPEEAEAISRSETNADLSVVFDEIMERSKERGDAVNGRLQTWEDGNRNIRLQEMTIIRSSGANPNAIPGILP